MIVLGAANFRALYESRRFAGALRLLEAASGFEPEYGALQAPA